MSAPKTSAPSVSLTPKQPKRRPTVSAFNANNTYRYAISPPTGAHKSYPLVSLLLLKQITLHKPTKTHQGVSLHLGQQGFLPHLSDISFRICRVQLTTPWIRRSYGNSISY